MTQQKIHKTAIVGARGYTGLELARILLRHPGASLEACFATDTGFALSNYLPEGAAQGVPTRPLAELESVARRVSTVFLATPAETSAELAPKLLESGAHVIDLSGAFRLKGKDLQNRQELYSQWYGMKHPSAELLDRAQFGLVPWTCPLATGPTLISNPGCYATSILMAILPLLKGRLIEPSTLVIDAKSGTSGAGRKPTESSLFTEVDGECLPYKVAKHQHFPEICEYAEAFGGVRIDPMLSTSLIPVRRGIISAIYARLETGVSAAQVTEAYEAAYRNYPLVRTATIQPGKGDALLSLKRVVGSARTHISFAVEGDKLYVYSCIDNLLKGAASQAVENFNRLQDYPVATALTELEGVL